jgi:hypothetical protein
MLEAFGKEGVFLAQITRFENVSPDELFLLQAESLDDALALHVLLTPYLFLTVMSHLHGSHFFFKLGHSFCPRFLFFFELFDVFLLPLP